MLVSLFVGWLDTSFLDNGSKDDSETLQNDTDEQEKLQVKRLRSRGIHP